MAWAKLTAIVRRDVLPRVEDRLQSLRVQGLSVTPVSGFGEYADLFRRDWRVPHVRIEIFSEREWAHELARCIVEEAHTGGAGDGLVAVLPVEEVWRVRTRRTCRPGEL